MVMGQISDRELHEECGGFGGFGVKDAASLTYYGLHALQHRGQESCGIAVTDTYGKRNVLSKKGLPPKHEKTRLPAVFSDRNRLEGERSCLLS